VVFFLTAATHREVIVPQPVYVPPAEPVVQAFGIGPWTVASSDGDYPFVFTARLNIKVPAGHSPGSYLAIVQHELKRRVRDVVASIDPTYRHVALNAVEDQLMPQRDYERYSYLVSDMSLRLSPADENHLEELDQIRKRTDVQRKERDLEQELCTYLSENVLQSTGKSLVWWLARNHGTTSSADTLETAVALIPTLAQITAAADDRVPDLDPSGLADVREATLKSLFPVPGHPQHPKNQLYADAVAMALEAKFPAEAEAFRSAAGVVLPEYAAEA
jgi:hypothetical protein